MAAQTILIDEAHAAGRPASAPEAWALAAASVGRAERARPSDPRIVCHNEAEQDGHRRDSGFGDSSPHIVPPKRSVRSVFGDSRARKIQCKTLCPLNLSLANASENAFFA